MMAAITALTIPLNAAAFLTTQHSKLAITCNLY